MHERLKSLFKKQREGESVQQYVTELKIRQNSRLNEMKENFICSAPIYGLVCNDLRERLLEDDKITLDRAVRLCLSVEESKIQVIEMAGKSEVNSSS